MANQDAAFGMRPVGRIGGMPFTGGQSRYRIAANYGTSIFQGDMVAQVTGGTVEVHADGGTVPIVGVFNGVQYTAAFPVADLFGNFDIVYTSSGSTTTGISGAELDVATGATTAGLPLKCIDISQDPENSDVSSDATNVHVVIQNSIFGQKGAGLA